MQSRVGQDQAARLDSFRAQTFRFVGSMYADALCLTNTQEDAADLVVAAYVHAFHGYDLFQLRDISKKQRSLDTLAWLHGSLHTVFCDGVLSKEAARGVAVTGAASGLDACRAT